MGSDQPSKNSKVKGSGPVQLSNRCNETQAQIQTVLQVVAFTSNALQGYLHRPHFYGQEENKEVPPPLKMTEGQIALEKTLWSACSRMEKLLENDALWSDDFQRKVEKDYTELHGLQMDAIERQRQAAAEVTSPHFRYRPALQRMKDGRWMAILGDETQLQFAIYGIGYSAQQAIDEFDSVFLRGVPKSVADWCVAREQDFENGTELNKPFPNNTNDKKVDDTGNGSGNSTPT